eukprot:8688161-Pyramimonas_sp.AAC.1
MRCAWEGELIRSEAKSGRLSCIFFPITSCVGGGCVCCLEPLPSERPSGASSIEGARKSLGWRRAGAAPHAHLGK